MRNSLHATTKSKFHVVGLLLAFLAVLVDGFDTAILAMLVPHLAADWGVSPAAFSYPLVLTNIGVVVGYLSCGAMARRIGVKLVLSLGLLLFGIATILTAIILPLESMTLLSLARALTGVGLGVVLPTAVIVGTQLGPEERRQPISVFVTMGMISGATVAGFAGGSLIGAIGSTGVLWIAGLFPLLLALLLQIAVPVVSATVGQSANPAAGSDILSILRGRQKKVTIALWTATFLIFTVTYTLKSWIPTLFSEYGLSTHDAGLGLAYYSLGGVFAGLLLMPLSAKFGAARSLVLMTLVAAAATAMLGSASLGQTALMALVFIAGAGITTGTIGQTAMAVAMYESAVRTTGVGWSAAFGRTGSVLGPAMGGLLLALAWPAQSIVLVLTVPILLTAVGWVVLAQLSKSAEPAIGQGPDSSPARPDTAESQSS